MIRNLVKADAKVIAYNVQFSQESASIDADNALILAVRSGKRGASSWPPRRSAPAA